MKQWQVGVDHPGDIICVGPKYQYDYSGDSQHIHMSSLEYEKLGEKMAQVYLRAGRARATTGSRCSPISGTVSGNTITVQFHVPVPPLVWDDRLPAAPQRRPVGQRPRLRGQRRGALRRPSTRSTSSAPDTVQITCHNDLTGLAVTVGYAVTTDGVAAARRHLSAGGCSRTPIPSSGRSPTRRSQTGPWHSQRISSMIAAPRANVVTP